MDISIKWRKHTAFSEGSPFAQPMRLSAVNFPPAAYVTKIVAGRRPSLCRPPLRLEGRLFGEQPTQPVAHPVGKGRIGHLPEGHRLHGMDHTMEPTALAYRAHCFRQGCGFVPRVEQAKEQRVHGWASWGTVARTAM